ncbi:hypothetical protein Droror1_Dr00021744 [Drosera rotundifolia]
MSMEETTVWATTITPCAPKILDYSTSATNDDLSGLPFGINLAKTNPLSKSFGSRNRQKIALMIRRLQRSTLSLWGFGVSLNSLCVSLSSPGQGWWLKTLALLVCSLLAAQLHSSLS